MEYDLIKLGLRLEWLGTEALTWRDLLVIARVSPSDSAIALALDPELSWGMQEQLLAGVFDMLHILAWRQTADGQAGRNAPQPLPRPGVKSGGTRFGDGAMTEDEAAAWLRERNPLQHGG